MYMYYLNLAKIQDTNLVHTSVPLTMKEIRWGRTKVVSARSNLKKLGLIEDFRPTIGSKTYVKMNELSDMHEYTLLLYDSFGVDVYSVEANSLEEVITVAKTHYYNEKHVQVMYDGDLKTRMRVTNGEWHRIDDYDEDDLEED